MRRKLIGVVGGHAHNTSSAATALAREAGRLLGERNYGVVCGGSSGIMQAACEGNREGGGTPVGILKFNDPDAANESVEIAIATSMDVASNNVIIWSAEAIIAFEGRFGTLNEIALALDAGKPLIVMGAAPLLNQQAVSSEAFWNCPDPAIDDLPTVLDRMEQMIEASQGKIVIREGGAK